ncbi:MAG TPA: hypothetical protein VGG99_21670 [Acetobacteraceae bacterium]
MSIGGEYRLEEIGPRQWRRFAADARLDEAGLTERIVEMAIALPDLASDEVRRARATGLDHAVLDRMTDVLAERARRCARLMGGT